MFTAGQTLADVCLIGTMDGVKEQCRGYEASSRQRYDA